MRHEVLIVSGTSGPVAATATVTFTGTQTGGQIITIVDTAGTSKAYLAASAQDLTTDPPKFDCDGSAAAGATSLKACIEHANGHNGKILVSAVPTEADGAQEITLTQAIPGVAGRTAVTEDLATISKT